MAIPAAKVRTVCSKTEIELVRASRKPELAQLTPAQVKRLAVRARTLAKKWQDLGRGQSRTLGRVVGTAEADKNTQLKAQIFQEALTSLEARLGSLDGAAAAPAKKAATKKSAAKKPAAAKTLAKKVVIKPKKKQRAVEHRATRAAVRKGMAASEDLLNRKLGGKR